MLKPDEIFLRAKEAEKLSSPCRLCPRACGVDRTSGETGYCGAGPEPSVAAILPHFGEEPPLTGPGGAGTIFFSRCNLRCVYCQNHQISQGDLGCIMSPDELALRILDLANGECSTIEPVSPTHHLPGLLKALAIAVEQGMRLPVVYNTNGYESIQTLELLDGIVDIYLPDLKYASNRQALKYSDAADYVEKARLAVLAMHRQVGNLVVDLKGQATSGLILRHLVLPGNLSATEETLIWVRENFPLTVTLSLMAQYSPLHKSESFPPLDRTITGEEYERAVDIAWELGFENVFVQEMDSGKSGVPDFCLSNPFNWE
ncbi:MAG: radical SAM protein [Desulfomonilaceae bacterium]